MWNIADLRAAGFYVDSTDYPPRWNIDIDCLCAVNVEQVLLRSGTLFEYNKEEDAYIVKPDVKTNSYKPTQDQEQQEERDK